jgi:hypothetical protein
VPIAKLREVAPRMCTARCQMQLIAANILPAGSCGRSTEKRREVLDPLHVVMLGLCCELADRHVFDHAPAQRANNLVGHGSAPVLSEVVETLDLKTGRLHPLRLLIIARARATSTYRERFSPLARSGGSRQCSDTTGVGGKADISLCVPKT